MIENTSGERGWGEEHRAHTSTERPRLWPRQRCRGLEHTLAAEWFHLRISVITFRSVIYSWPSAAPHDPPLPQPFDQRKRQWLCKQALSVDSNGFTACFFSLVSLESSLICTETQFYLTEPTFLPVLIYGPDHDWREPKREWGGGSGGLREGERVEVGTAWGPSHPLPAGWAGQGGSRHGKSPVGALLSAGAIRLCGLCAATITPTRKIGPVGFICVCWDSQEAESMWVS